MGFKEKLRGILPDRLMEYAPSSFDVVGDICIIEMKDEIRDYWKDIAEFIVSEFKNINSVWLKASERKGEYRTRELVHLAGENRSETMHKESGCRFYLDILSCYFSPREGTERERVLDFIEPGDRVMTFFAGVGPFPICISKHTDAMSSDGIEINPKAVEYFRRNVDANRVRNVTVFEGDVSDFTGNSSYDHVFMPLPKFSFRFIPKAIEFLRDGGTMHLYFFSDSAEDGISEIERHSIAEIIDTRKVLPYGPGIWKWRVSARISKPQSTPGNKVNDDM